MHILVCIKQVPDVGEIKFDPDRKTLIREGVKNIVNPFDRRAVAQAVALAHEHGGEVVVMTMGPPQARQALLECLAVGAGRAVHLEDPVFAGSDTLATARTLALAVRQEACDRPFDLIFCGKHAVDAETGQVGPELAELLGMPHVGGATEVEVKDRNLLVTRETDEGFEIIEVPIPCLLTAAERLIRPVKISEADLEQARTRALSIVRAADLTDDLSLFGFAGSPTSVSEIYERKTERSCRFVTPEEFVRELIERGWRDHLLSGNLPSGDSEKAFARTSDPRNGREIWVVAEMIGETVRPVTFEILGRSLELADRIEGEVTAVLIGAEGQVDPRLVGELGRYGAERILYLTHPALKEYSSEGWANALSQAIERQRPWAVLIPATANGRDYAPRVAARLGLGLTGDCVGLKLDDEGRLVQLKPAFGGQIIAPILSRTSPQMATIRPGMLSKLSPDGSRQARIERVGIDPFPIRTRIIDRTLEARAAIKLDGAPLVVCVGMGVGGPDNLPIVEDLARALDGVIGATRRVVDAGWVSRQYQIGVTGRAIAPWLYLGVGVRGAFNHTIGIQRAQIIAAINTDPQADIFKTADLGMVGDFALVVPEIMRRLHEFRRSVAESID